MSFVTHGRKCSFSIQCGKFNDSDLNTQTFSWDRWAILAFDNSFRLYANELYLLLLVFNKRWTYWCFFLKKININQNLRLALQCHIVLNNFRPSGHHVLWQQMRSGHFEIEIELKSLQLPWENIFEIWELLCSKSTSHNLAELKLTLVFPSQDTRRQNNSRVCFNPTALSSFLRRSIICQFISMTSGPSSAGLCVTFYK